MGIFLSYSMSLTGCQINPIDVNFHLKKSLEILEKKSADKLWSKKDKEIKVSPFVLIRVNLGRYLQFCPIYKKCAKSPNFSTLQMAVISHILLE